jgi:hypothetical protein
MNSTNKEKLIVNVEVCEEGEHNITHKPSTITLKSRQW